MSDLERSEIQKNIDIVEQFNGSTFENSPYNKIYDSAAKLLSQLLCDINSIKDSLNSIATTKKD
jgi:hypothetical protein